MALMLATNTALTELVLDNNIVGNYTGATALTAALALNNLTLTALQLSGNSARETALAKLAVLTHRNTHVAKLCRPLLQLMCAPHRLNMFLPAEIWGQVRWQLALLQAGLWGRL